MMGVSYRQGWEQMMTRWIRYEHEGKDAFGTLDSMEIIIYDGDMFANPIASGEKIPLVDVKILPPTKPTKMPALWNNYHTMAEKMGNAKPIHPLYFFKPPNSFLGSGETIRRPVGYKGKVVYEGEIGIVIGRTCHNADEETAANSIFGYTCINDVTAVDIISSDESFAQWTRSKGFDGFGVFGPVVSTNLNTSALYVKTFLIGDERQNYTVSDMIIKPVDIVRLLSWDMTLEQGDIICCGTNVGVGPMKEPSNKIEVTIEGIGTLSNVFEN